MSYKIIIKNIQNNKYLNIQFSFNKYGKIKKKLLMKNKNLLYILFKIDIKI